MKVRFMKHKMKLNNEPFESIKNGTKTIELRLYDEKRSLINVNDIIEFTNIDTNEILNVLVLKLHKYCSFNELYKNFDKVKLGYKPSEIANPDDMNQYFILCLQEKYGVLGIEIKVLN